MNLKRILSLLLCLVMIFGCVIPLASCKKDEPDNSDSNKPPVGNVTGGDSGNGNGDNGKTNQIKEACC